MRKTFNLRHFAALPVLAMLFSAACSSGSDPAASGAVEVDHDHPLALLKEQAPVGDFTVSDLDGKVITSEALKGKVVFVNFWATWCPPCRAEIPDLIRLQEQYKDDVVVIGISEDEGPIDEVRAFVAEHKVNYFIAMATPELANVFKGVSALPTTFVIGRDGKIVQRHVGQLDPHDTVLEAEYLTGRNTNMEVVLVDDPKTLQLRNAAQATEIPGVDLTQLTPEQRTSALKALNAQDCTCGCTLTLAACRINDPQCDVSLPLAKALVEKIAKGN